MKVTSMSWTVSAKKFTSGISQSIKVTLSNLSWETVGEPNFVFSNITLMKEISENVRLVQSGPTSSSGMVVPISEVKPLQISVSKAAMVEMTKS